MRRVLEEFEVGGALGVDDTSGVVGDVVEVEDADGV